jgi:hypothetical protein
MQVPVVRILEIDATPAVIPSEVEKLLAPIVNGQPVGVEVKAGELPDADLPTSHSSYYVAMRIRDSEQEVLAEMNELAAKVIAFCNARRLPIVEVSPQHPEFVNLLADFGWS